MSLVTALDARRGDVFWTILDKRRPAVVCSADIYCENPRCQILLVLPLTTLRRHPRRDQAIINPPEGGVDRQVVTIGNGLQPVTRDDLVEYMGTLSELKMREIEYSLSLVLGMV